MKSFRISLLLTCLGVAIQNVNSHETTPGNCEFINYCTHLRQAQISPIGSHAATCPDPNICEKELEYFKARPPSKVNKKVIPVDDVGYDPVKVFTGCQLQPHCGRIPVKKARVQLWPSTKYSVPVRCNFVNYCDSLRQYNYHPIGSNPGVCPDPMICGRDVESFVRRRELKTPSQLLAGSAFCMELDKCGKVQPKRRPVPQYIAFNPDADPDLLPGTCKDLRHCGRTPQRESRPPNRIDTGTGEGLPSSCEGKLHCERKPQRESRPPTTIIRDGDPSSCEGKVHCERTPKRDSRPVSSTGQSNARPNRPRQRY